MSDQEQIVSDQNLDSPATPPPDYDNPAFVNDEGGSDITAIPVAAGSAPKTDGSESATIPTEDNAVTNNDIQESTRAPVNETNAITSEPTSSTPVEEVHASKSDAPEATVIPVEEDAASVTNDVSDSTSILIEDDPPAASSSSGGATTTSTTSFEDEQLQKNDSEANQIEEEDGNSMSGSTSSDTELESRKSSTNEVPPTIIPIVPIDDDESNSTHSSTISVEDDAPEDEVSSAAVASVPFERQTSTSELESSSNSEDDEDASSKDEDSEEEEKEEVNNTTEDAEEEPVPVEPPAHVEQLPPKSRHISIDEDGLRRNAEERKAYLPHVISADDLQDQQKPKRRPSRVSIMIPPTEIYEDKPEPIHFKSTARPGRPDTIWTTSPNGRDLDAEEDAEEDRDTWDNPIEFLLSCISMSVGLGNVWRFPGTAARNGGGAFLIPYLVVLLVIGRPLYYLEMCLGQFSRYGQVKVWNMAPLFKGVGYGSMIGIISVCSYYCALMGISMHFFFKSFAKDLPWDVCHQDDLPAGMNCSDPALAGLEATNYFDYTVFPQKKNLDDGLGDLHWQLALCLVASWALIFFSLVKGVKSSGKVAYFTAIFPYIVLFILLIRGVTLKGAGTGIKKFLEPDWDALAKPKVWYAAVEQCFFSLATGFGPVVMFSSYNKFNQNVYKDALIISILDTFTSLLAGFTVFSVMGNLMETTGLKFEDISVGPGLAFVLYPQAIARFDWAPQLFAVLFFLMLFTLGIGSATSLTGGVITIICDQFPRWPRWLVTLVICSAGSLVGLLYVTEGGLFMLDLVDHYGAGFIIYVMVVLETAGISYVYGLSNFCHDIEFMIGRKVGIYWKICWGLVLPLGLFGILLYYLITEPEYQSGNTPYPKVATVCGWLLAGFAVALVPAWGLHAVVTRKASSLGGKFMESLKPTRRWGPQRAKLRREWLEFRAQKDEEVRRRRFYFF